VYVSRVWRGIEFEQSTMRIVRQRKARYVRHIPVGHAPQNVGEDLAGGARAGCGRHKETTIMDFHI
jgi:hypothetical protein